MTRLALLATLLTFLSGTALAVEKTVYGLNEYARLQGMDLQVAAKLDTGAPVELGRGTTEEITARAQRFVSTLTQATSRYGRRPEALVAADLRHADGYAIRLRGVSTLGNDGQKK